MYRVLIADDEPIERVVVSRTLHKYFQDQLEIIQAVNGREAIEKCQEQRCQIVILDVEMPGINGLEAAEQIRRYDKECSIIFLTAFDYFTYAKKAITVRALDYLLKPSSEEELIAVVEEGMRLADAQKEDGVSEIAVANEAFVTEGEKIECIRMNIVQEKILDFIQNHYTEDISLQDVARAMNYSDAYFCKLFKQCFEKSFTTYLSEFRIEKAKQLLVDVTINVKEISDKVGYRDSNYFAKVFKRREGVTPSEYRILALGK
ncbi:DNA-binding response regulator [Sporanaerobium hydrogeniformans]|uniref:DNA-binding response regulator n=1 Tax=Sporanaerobium hydrogeniformans TaxID=3072179 RepID=A0AC61DB18_9FIRM|nr:response regulator [Sporanaerobium hydrogeniformans]PHV69797.1 DNA-binding response regulator [Sporanaerobium hydrogeniformans]